MREPSSTSVQARLVDGLFQAVCKTQLLIVVGMRGQILLPAQPSCVRRAHRIVVLGASREPNFVLMKQVSEFSAIDLAGDKCADVDEV
jgi:hypothetical protein